MDYITPLLRLCHEVIIISNAISLQGLILSLYQVHDQ